MKAVNLLIDDLLPEDIRDPNRVFDKKGMGQLFKDIKDKHPDRFAELSKKIMDAGRHASYIQGETLTLADMRPVLNKKDYLDQMDLEIEEARKTIPNKKEFEKKRNEIYGRYASILQKETIKEAIRKGNNIGNTVVSGARGNPTQLSAMLTTPGLYTDYKGDVIPMFIRNSYGEGLRPSEYLASLFGVRSSVISTKNATADAGDVLKQLTVATADQIVTTSDCGTSNGIDLDIEDSSLRGRTLARETAGLPAGTVLDRDAINHLRKNKIDTVLVRSALTCQARDGLCAHCHGIAPDGNLPPIGYAAGITASQSIGEPLAQGALNKKHTSGAFEGGKRVFAGFDVINQILQTPEAFPDRASVAEVDGTVTKIEEAEHGGHYVYINGEPHYVIPGMEIYVKKGDKVERGDQLSDGIVDSADIVRLRGLGEGRRFFSERLKQALEDSGIGANLRNTEVVARSAVNHLSIENDEGIGDYLPGDTASYNHLVHNYSPPKDSKVVQVSEGIAGSYLQQPVLHYSVGTKLTPSMINRLKKNKFDTVFVSNTPPDFNATMVRLRGAAHNNPDWLARFHGSYLKNTLAESAYRGRDTNIEENVHFAPRLAVGKGFGEKIEETGKF